MKYVTFLFKLHKNNVFALENISQKTFTFVNYGSCTRAVNFHHTSEKCTKYQVETVGKIKQKRCINVEAFGNSTAIVTITEINLQIIDLINESCFMNR